MRFGSWRAVPCHRRLNGTVHVPLTLINHKPFLISRKAWRLEAGVLSLTIIFSVFGFTFIASDGEFLHPRLPYISTGHRDNFMTGVHSIHLSWNLKNGFFLLHLFFVRNGYAQIDRLAQPRKYLLTYSSYLLNCVIALGFFHSCYQDALTNSLHICSIQLR